MSAAGSGGSISVGRPDTPVEDQGMLVNEGPPATDGEAPVCNEEAPVDETGSAGEDDILHVTEG